MMKIKGRNLYDELVVEIGKFAILWNYFEKTYFANNCTANKIQSDAKYIRLYAKKQSELAVVFNK